MVRIDPVLSEIQATRAAGNDRLMILGCGPSLQEMPNKRPPCPSLGANYCWKWARPDWLLVLDSPASFPHERRVAIQQSRCKAMFVTDQFYMAWFDELKGKNVTPIRKLMWEDMEKGPKPRVTSPGFASYAAMHFGFKKVGIIGMDLYSHPRLSRDSTRLNRVFAKVRELGEERGVEFYNLSPLSMVVTLKRMDLADWWAESEEELQSQRQREAHTESAAWPGSGGVS